MDTIAESEVVEMEVELQVYDKVSAAVDAAMERCANIVLCYDTPKDITESKSWIFQNLNKLNPLIKQAGKLGKAEALKFTRAMYGKEKDLLQKVAKQIEEKYAPIKLIEDASAKKKAEEEAKIKAEEERMEAERQAELEAREEAVRIEREKLEKEKEEIARVEREKAIAEEAKKKAEETSKQAAIDALVSFEEAKVAAENRRIADVQREKDKAAAEAAALSAHLASLEAKEKKLAEETEFRETERINNEAHRKDVNNKILETILGKCVSEASAKALICDMINGKVPNVTVNY